MGLKYSRSKKMPVSLFNPNPFNEDKKTSEAITVGETGTEKELRLKNSMVKDPYEWSRQ